MNAVEFLKAMWPLQGHYVLVTGPHKNKRGGSKPVYYHHLMKSMEDAAQFIAAERTNTNVYYATQTYKVLVERTGDGGRRWMSVERTAENAAFARSQPLDLDVGTSTATDPKYASVGEALQDLQRFVREAGLPIPTIVLSGRGVHAYWRFDEDVPSEAWVVVAELFKRVVAARKLKADRNVTADRARILRPVNSINRKDPENPVWVKLAGPLRPALSFAAWRAMVEALAVDLPPAPSPSLATQSGIILPTDFKVTPPSPKRLARECATFVLMMQGAADAPEPLWFATCQLARHTSAGEALAHEIAKQHPDYEHDTTQAKLDHLSERNIGPPTCGSLEKLFGDASPCKACKHYGSLSSSPVVFARRAPDAVLPPEIPDAPDGFRRTKGGVQAEIVGKDEDGDPEPLWVTIYPYDLYPLRIIDDAANKRKVVEWQANVPQRGDIIITTPIDTYVETNKMVSTLVNQGVTLEMRHAKKMGDYVSLYIRQLQKHAAEQQQIDHLGWVKEHSAFAMPSGMMTANGTTPIVLGPKLVNTASAFVKGGTLEKQVAALRFYRDPAYVRQQVAICVGLVAPLFFMTGHYGLLINLNGPSGASKSTTLYALSGHWGHPPRVTINGTASGMTQMARMGRLEIYANLPVVLDDVTDMDPEALKETAMGVTQPGQKIRLQRDGTERPVPDEIKSTVMILSSNPSLHALLSQNNVAGDAGSMRLFEMYCDRLAVHTKMEADHFLREINTNYGHTGPALIEYMLQHRAEVEALLHATMREVETRAHIPQQERYWHVAMGLAVFGARIGRKLGLLDYDPEHMMRWLIEEQLPDMRQLVHDTYMDPVSALQGFLADNVNNVLQVSHVNGGYVLVQGARDKATARLELTSGRMWILIASFKTWCFARKLPFDSIVRDLVGAKVVEREKMDIARHLDAVRVGAGWTLRINLQHEAMEGSTVATGNVVQFPSKGSTGLASTA